MNLKSRFFNITSLIIVFFMVVSMIPVLALADSEESKRVYTLTEEDLIAAAYPLIEAQSKFYNIVDKQLSNVESTVQSDGTIDTTFSLTLSMVLKANSVSDLPYIKGMLQKVGVANVDEGSSTAIADKIAQNPSITSFVKIDMTKSEKIQKDEIPMIMADIIKDANSDYGEYIGKTSELCYILKVKANSEGEVLSVGALTFNDYVPLEVFFPQSELEMMANGANTFEEAVLSALEKRISSTQVEPNAIINPAYKRVSARNYANTWTSTVSSSPYIDETKYNNAKYTSQNANGGDCANYVSQAMYEGGGVAQDSIWKPYTSAWNYVPSVRTYFKTTKAYWNTSTNASCNAGGILIYCNSSGNAYHVSMCVLNDTVNKAYSAHNKDRKNVPYTTDLSLTGVATDYIEYYVFNNVVDN